MEILQARILECPPLGHLPNPGIELRSPTLQADSSPSEPPGKPTYSPRNASYRKVRSFLKSSIDSHSLMFPFVSPQAVIMLNNCYWLLSINTPREKGFLTGQFSSQSSLASEVLQGTMKVKWSRSVVSNSSRPHGLHPTRLLHPWIFQARVLEWGAITLILCFF